MAKRNQRAIIAACLAMAGASCLLAADWPQWRGPNRDGKAADFKVPQTWPAQLAQKWKSPVGAGNSTALVGDKLYVFARQDADEVTLCLDANTGKEIWKDKYPAVTVTGPAAQHAGPRSSPTVAEGKVVTLGVGGMLSCLDAATGKVAWRKESTKDFSPAWPGFFAAMSPIVVDGMCIAHLGGAGKGAIIAFDLATGDPRWKWEGEGPTYSSPVIMTVEGSKELVEAAEQSIVGLSLSDGRLLWKTSTSAAPGRMSGRGPGEPGAAGGPPAADRGPAGAQAPGGPPGPGNPRRGGRGGGMNAYNTATPVIDDNTLYFSGKGGTLAFKVEKGDEAIAARELWNNPEASTAFNTPVLKDGLLYGLSGSNSLFCLDAKEGRTLWVKPLSNGGAGGGGGGGGRRGPSGFGSIVDAGSVLLALTDASELIVFKPDKKEYAEVARIKVSDSPTYAYPIAVGNRLFIKDRDSLTLYVIE